VDEKNKQRHNKIDDADSALKTQVGGDHYKGFEIQPVEFTTKNKLGFLPGDIVKRICRYKIPGGKGLEDLRKIKHEIDLIIELEGQDLGNKKVPLNMPLDLSKTNHYSAQALLLAKKKETELRLAIAAEMFVVLDEAKNSPDALDKLYARLGLTLRK